MPVAVNQPQRQREEKDPLDTILKGLQIAGGVFGIKEGMDKAADLKAQREMQASQRAEDVAHREKQYGLEERKLEQHGELERAKMRLKPPPDPYAVELKRLNVDKAKRDAIADAQALETPYGNARTPDDAKQLKSAGELKSTFDDKIDELIQLRSDYGGEVWNRDAVARGKQLSSDLLLLKKDMAKLGVLSKSDEGILNSIIPQDPLEINWTGAFDGQDPTMTRLKAFKSDTVKDFESRLTNRLQGGALKPPGGHAAAPDALPANASFSPPRTEVPPDVQKGAQAELIKRNGLKAARLPGK